MKDISALSTTDVSDALTKVLNYPSTETLSYMDDNGEMEDAILQTAFQATSEYLLRIIAAGNVSPTQATALGNRILPVMAFNLGLAAGHEVASADSFVDMMLGLGGCSEPGPDAG